MSYTEDVSNGQGSRSKPSLLMTVASTSAVWITLAALIFMLRRVPAASIFESVHALRVQIGIAVLCGSALAGSQLVLPSVWSQWRAYTIDAIREVEVTRSQIVAIAAMVAAAEEVFFRAALQPLVGLWGSSAIFVVVHLRIDRGAWAGERLLMLAVLLLLLYAISLTFGILYAQVGLASAMAAHFVYDVVMFEAYRVLRTRQESREGSQPARPN